MALLHALRQSWEKNWPELRSAVTGGIPAFVFARRPSDPTPGVPVFCYHLVETDAFRRDLTHLAHGGYTTLDAEALLDHLQGRRPAPPRAVVLSFDDGPVNFYRVAFPLLQSFSMRAVCFIAPCFHDDANNVDVNVEQRPCTWQEIQQMHASGAVDVQSHTHSHRYIPRWPEPAALTGMPAATVEAKRGQPLSLEQDLQYAKHTLETRLDKPIRHLAFPRYDGTTDAIAVAQRLGYVGFWWGVLPHRPLNRPGDDPSHIVRISGEFLRRLPGEDRAPLAAILKDRYAASLRRWTCRA